jgi:hypothetical protein
MIKNQRAIVTVGGIALGIIVTLAIFDFAIPRKKAPIGNAGLKEPRVFSLGSGIRGTKPRDTGTADSNLKLKLAAISDKLDKVIDLVEAHIKESGDEHSYRGLSAPGRSLPYYSFGPKRDPFALPDPGHLPSKKFLKPFAELSGPSSYDLRKDDMGLGYLGSMSGPKKGHKKPILGGYADSYPPSSRSRFGGPESDRGTSGLYGLGSLSSKKMGSDAPYKPFSRRGLPSTDVEGARSSPFKLDGGLASTKIHSEEKSKLEDKILEDMFPIEEPKRRGRKPPSVETGIPIIESISIVSKTIDTKPILPPPDGKDEPKSGPPKDGGRDSNDSGSAARAQGREEAKVEGSAAGADLQKSNNLTLGTNDILASDRSSPGEVAPSTEKKEKPWGFESDKESKSILSQIDSIPDSAKRGRSSLSELTTALEMSPQETTGLVQSPMKDGKGVSLTLNEAIDKIIDDEIGKGAEVKEGKSRSRPKKKRLRTKRHVDVF